MNVKLVCSVFLVALSGNAMATSFEACPLPADVRHQGGVYTAPTNTNGGEWLGVISSARPAALTAFDNAVFYAGDGSTKTVGVLSKCAYVSANGDRVDLRYRPGQPTDITVKLENIAAWKREEGPFGLVQFTCSDKSKGAFAFVEYK